MLTAAAYDIYVEQLLDRMRRFHAALSAAGIPYRIVGGMAVFVHVVERDQMAARLTNDVDAAVNRGDLNRIAAVAEQCGFRYRHAAGIDMLVDAGSRGAKSAVHLVFLNEKVRPEYAEPIPASEPVRTKEGILIAPVADLVRMKLTSFRLEIEATLSPLFRERLAEVRATE
jgi:hypothetical protein